MLKELDSLESAINRLLDQVTKRGNSGLAGIGKPAQGSRGPGEAAEIDTDREEAAELIRRAVKRLRSL